MGKNGELKVEGLDELISFFERLPNDPSYIRLTQKAVKAGADQVGDAISKELSSVKDKGYSEGYTVEELTVGNASKTKQGIISRIGWKGQHKRYAIAHLNEFGYSKNGKTYKQPMFGKVTKAVESSKASYIKVVEETLIEGLKDID